MATFSLALIGPTASCLAKHISVFINSMNLSALPWDFIVILLVLAVFVPWRGVIRVRALLAGPGTTSADRIAIYASTIALQWAAAGLTAWRCAARGLSASSLGVSLSHPLGAVGMGLAIAFAFTLLQIAGFRHLSRIPAEQRGRVYEVTRKVMPRNATEALAFTALVCTVSLCEEFLFRGFVFAVFQQVFRGSVPAAVIGSSALFAVAHLYQGRRGISTTFLLGTILALARLSTHSLAPGIIVHFVVDLLAGLAAPGALWDIARQETGTAAAASPNERVH